MAKAKKAKAGRSKAPKKNKASKAESKAKKSKAKKPVKRAAATASRSVKKSKAKKSAPKKAARKPAKAKRPAAAKAKKAPAKVAAKAAPKKKKQIVGEGDYQASRKFLNDEANFVKRHNSEIPQMGKDAEAALDGPQGAELRAAEAEARSHSKAAGPEQ